MKLIRRVIASVLHLGSIGAALLLPVNAHAVVPARGEQSAVDSQNAWPSVFLFRASNPERFCSAVVIGPQVILTAASCATTQPSNATATIRVSGGRIPYRLTCAVHPRYPQEPSADFALCKTDQPLPSARIERINTDPSLLALGSELMLVGYGCRDPITRAFDGQLSFAPSVVVAPPRTSAIEAVVAGAAACAGDAGGGAFFTGDRRPEGPSPPLAGIISRGQPQGGQTILATTSSEAFVRWAKAWSSTPSGAAICGLDAAPHACTATSASNLTVNVMLPEFRFHSAAVALSEPTSAPTAIANRQPEAAPPLQLRQVAFRKGETLAAVVQISCLGTADEPYLDRVLAFLERDGTPLKRDHLFDAPGSLTLPVCPPASSSRSPAETALVEVSPSGPKRLWDYFVRLKDDKKLGGSWEFEYREDSGPRLTPAGPESRYFVDVFRALNPAQDPKALTPGQITLPLRRKRPASNLDLPAANIDVLEPILALQSTEDADDGCSKRQDDLTYPIDVAGLLDALVANAQARGNRRIQDAARVVIIDSGLYAERRDDTVFRDVLYIDRQTIPSLQRQQFIKGVEPRLPNAANAAHGTGVASVALGGPLFARIHAADTGAEPRIRLDPYRLHESRGGHAVIPADKFNNTFQDLTPRGTVIVNLSLRTSNTLSAVRERLGDRGPNFLFVVAAGNGNQAAEGQRLRADRGGDVFPAVYGGPDNEGEANLIAVAALYRDNRTWKRAPFSDYSPEHVEIGAPGCSIPVFFYDRDEEAWAPQLRRERGTSFAAPLVAFAAGLIVAENPDLSARAVKDRILAGADLNPALAGEIADGRSLNVVKAVSIHHDVLEVNRQTARGWLRLINLGSGAAYNSSEALPMKCAGAPDGSLRLSDVRKIVPGFNTAAGAAAAQFPDRIYVARGAKRRLTPLDCALTDEIAVQFNRQGTENWLQYHWNEITDIVPHMAP